MSTISASTTSTTAYKVTADTTGTLVFQTGATPTTALTIGSDQSVTFAGTPTYSGGTANGVLYLNGSKAITSGSALVFDGTNLGVGTASPATKLNLGGSADQTFQINGSGTAAFLGTSTAVAQISSNRNPTTGAIYDSGRAVSYINLEASSGNANIQFYTTATNNVNATERARFNSTGAFVFAGGTTSANGIGITFPATQSASSDANTLDDYEEGTWTPTFSVGGTVFTGRAWYLKVGAVCYIGANNLEGVSAVADGDTVTITGLPFNIKQDSGTNNYKWGAAATAAIGDQSDGYKSKPFAGRINPVVPIGGNASAAKLDIRNVTGVATTTSDPFFFSGYYYTE